MDLFSLVCFCHFLNESMIVCSLSGPDCVFHVLVDLRRGRLQLPPFRQVPDPGREVGGGRVHQRRPDMRLVGRGKSLPLLNATQLHRRLQRFSKQEGEFLKAQSRNSLIQPMIPG